VLLWGRPARAFALRFEGRVVGYLNRCVHVAAEMDWQPGRFLDTQKRWIVCALHGATFEPSDGYCIAGPGRGSACGRCGWRKRAGRSGGGPMPMSDPPAHPRADLVLNPFRRLRRAGFPLSTPTPCRRTNRPRRIPWVRTTLR
jgi:nitrite reductase/ring-hydroxylating ferredoxin subunit